MTDIVNKIHFQELSDQDPKDVCRRAACAYDRLHEFYTLTVWGEDYRVFPHRGKIECVRDKADVLPEVFHLFIVHYLLKSKDIEIRNEWISEKDIPGGATFFRGPHEIPTKLISGRFNNDLHRYTKACEQLNGVPLNLADAAYSFEITSRIPVATLYWVGDDDFPAESKILYDRTIAEHLASDIIYALATGICQRLAETGGT